MRPDFRNIQSFKAAGSKRPNVPLLNSPWLRCYCLPWYFLPTVPLLANSPPLRAPSLLRNLPGYCSATFSCLSGSRVSVLDNKSIKVQGEGEGWGQVQATSKLGSLRHQKYKWTDRLHGGRGGILFAIERKAQSHSAELYCWRYYDSHIKVCLEINVIMSLLLVIEAVMTHDK